MGSIIASTIELTNLQYGLHGQDSEILRFIIESGKIDINDVLNSMEAMKRKELLEKHPYKIWQGKSPHRIRKTYGSILFDNHIDNKLIMEQMGRTDIRCTEEHYHRNRKNLDKKSSIISEIPEF